MTIKSAYWRILNFIKLKISGAQIGHNPDIKYKIYLKKDRVSKFRIGNNFTLYSGGGLNPLSSNIIASICIEKDAEIIIGDNVGISSSTLWAKKSIHIGDNTNIGANVVIIDSDCHSLNYIDRGTPADMKNTICKPINIGNNVLIGTGTYILKGVSIGDRSIIGAGSIVTQNIPADCIAAGNPCKVIKYFHN